MFISIIKMLEYDKIDISEGIDGTINNLFQEFFIRISLSNFPYQLLKALKLVDLNNQLNITYMLS